MQPAAAALELLIKDAQTRISASAWRASIAVKILPVAPGQTWLLKWRPREPRPTRFGPSEYPGTPISSRIPSIGSSKPLGNKIRYNSRACGGAWVAIADYDSGCGTTMDIYLLSGRRLLVAS
jgi:hypothetical protein